MTKVIFTGPEDIRELGSEDLQKASVEGFQTTQFLRGVATEVTPDVAKALIDNSKLFGKFKGASADLNDEDDEVIDSEDEDDEVFEEEVEETIPEKTSNPSPSAKK